VLASLRHASERTSLLGSVFISSKDINDTKSISTALPSSTVICHIQLPLLSLLDDIKYTSLSIASQAAKW
jgi:hypothetical protein